MIKQPISLSLGKKKSLMKKSITVICKIMSGMEAVKRKQLLTVSSDPV